jgi:predicted DNA-binding ribbon-helix-helix protein
MGATRTHDRSPVLSPETGDQRIVKRSVTLAGHRTSVSLETEFWDAVREFAAIDGTSVNALIGAIDPGTGTNLSSRIRVYVLERCRREAVATESRDATRTATSRDP